MTRSQDRVAARFLAALMLVFAVLLAYRALVTVDCGYWFAGVAFAVLGLAALILGGDE